MNLHLIEQIEKSTIILYQWKNAYTFQLKRLDVLIKTSRRFYFSPQHIRNQRTWAKFPEKARKQVSQVSPRHDLLNYRLPMWNFPFHRGFTSFTLNTLEFIQSKTKTRTLKNSGETCESWWMPQGSHRSFEYEQVKHRWNLWRHFTNLF